MKFDNAFLTASNKVGMQFRNKGQIVSAYRDKDNNIICSESLIDADKAKVVKKFVRLEPHYNK
jgi:hypothetical protein